MRTSIYILILLIFIGSSCKQKVDKHNFIENETENETTVKTTTKEVEKYQSELMFDNLLDKPKFNFLTSEVRNKIDTIDVSCNCEKDVKNNRIIIQLRKEFPVQSNLTRDNYSSRGIMAMAEYPYQITYLTLTIKDSLVDDFMIHRLSQEPQFSNHYKISQPIEKYKITLSKSKYNVAQDIWGEFQVILPMEFGIQVGDTVINGNFYCNNYQTERFIDYNPYPKNRIFNINSNLSFQEKVKYNDRDIFDEINPWECDCKLNTTKDTLFITNNHGDGLSGDKLTIKLTTQLKPTFIFETWTDCCSDYYLKYSFNKYHMVLNKNPFENEINNLIGTYWIASDTIPRLFGERLIKKGIFKCK